MKIKNEDGTINALPIAGIFTVLALALYILLFGLELKEKVEEKVNEIVSTTTTTTQKTTMSICNDCSISFIDNSFDIAINGELDLKEFMKLYKISINYIKFESSDKELFTISPYSSTFLLKTGGKTGSGKITATYENQTVEATINVITPSSAKIAFKYDYYFVKKKSSIEPEIVTYPYALNINNVKYCVNPNKAIISCNEKNAKITGRGVGTSNYSAELGRVKASTTIYVVENLINVKVNENGSYKVARGINAVSNSFDIIVEFENGKDQNYDYMNLTTTFDSNPLGAAIKFVSPNNSSNSYVYHIDIPEGTSGNSVLRIALPNGSFTLFNITK